MAPIATILTIALQGADRGALLELVTTNQRLVSNETMTLHLS